MFSRVVFFILLILFFILIELFVFPFVEEGLFFAIFHHNTLSIGEEVHPVLIYDSSNFNVLKSRLNTTPYSEIYASIKDKCNNYLNKNVEDERERAYASKVLSLCYAIEKDVKYGKRAEEFLNKAGDKKFRNIVSDYNYGLVYYSQAYDMLKGASWHFSNESLVRTKLKNLLLNRDNFLYLIWNYPSDIPGLFSFFNNHELRKASAIGIASINLADEKESNLLFKKSQYSFSRVVYFQSGGAGVWGEGPGYFSYSMQLAIPYLRAIKNYAHLNLMQSLDNKIEWAFNLTMNNGKLPNFDDSSYSYIIYPLIETNNSWKYNYIWNKYPYGKNGEYDVDLLFSNFNSKKYDFPELIIMNNTGAIIRRNGTYVLFLAENGVASTNYGHEHPDGLSIIIQKNNDMVLVDSGYWALENGSNERRPWLVNKDINHNVMLVDGKGQPKKYIYNPIESMVKGILSLNRDTNAYIKWFVRNPPSVSAYSHYNDAYVERVIVFMDDFMVLFDKGISTHKREYSLLFHTGSKEVHINSNLVEWGNSSLLSSENIKEFSQPISFNHYLKSQKTLNISTIGESAHFITIIFPKKENVGYSIIHKSNFNAIILDKGTSEYFIIFNWGKEYKIGDISGTSDLSIYKRIEGDTTKIFSYPK